jgi:hypothetical protein
MRKRLALLLAVGLMIAAIPLTSIKADLSQRELTVRKVTQYLSMQYSTKGCNGDTKYRINSIGRRWYKKSLNRRVAYRMRVVTKGWTCNDNLVRRTRDTGWAQACFGCDGNRKRWTPAYTSFYKTPYLGEECCYDTVGVSLIADIANRDGEHLGWACTQISKSGNVGCNLGN